MRFIKMLLCMTVTAAVLMFAAVLLAYAQNDYSQDVRLRVTVSSGEASSQQSADAQTDSDKAEASSRGRDNESGETDKNGGAASGKSSDSQENGKESVNAELPDTGDDSSVLLYAAMGAVVSAALTAAALGLRRKH